MKHNMLLALCCLVMCSTANAQLGGLLNKVKNKVNERIDKKVDKAIDKGLDSLEGKPPGAAAAPVASADKEETNLSKTSSIKSFSKYDFVPGEQIVYFDNFETDAIAELPAGWNTNGSGEVVTLDKFSGKWLRLHNPFIYLANSQQEFTENYTAEFDLVLQLKNNGWMYPEFEVGIYSQGTEASSNGNFFLKEYKKYGAVIAAIQPAEMKSSKAKLYSYADNKDYFISELKPFATLEQWYGTVIHIAIQVQKERFRMWVNEEKLFDVPKAMPLNVAMKQVFFKVGRTNYSEEQYGVYIGNIKVATGKPETQHKLAEEGKFSTTGILFDVNSAGIKPESNGVLKEIASVLNQYPSMKVKIIGHTDSDGSDAVNLELSKKRAAAVKEALSADFGIDASRLESDGKGEGQPVADNKTKEGKARNRRVEFLKQ